MRIIDFGNGSRSEVKFAMSAITMRFIVGCLAHTQVVFSFGGNKCNRLVGSSFVGAVAERLVLGQST